MCGTTRTSPRSWAEGPDYSNTYYKCPHDVANPKHAATHPDHPRTVTIREDTLVDVIRDGLARHVFGPDRAALLATQIPASAAQATEQRERHRDHLTKELARIDLAQRSQITQIDTLDPDPANTAAQAMRHRCYERFAELQTERETTQTQLDTLDHTGTDDNDISLLDLMPLLARTIDIHPEHIQAALYQAFDIQALYKDDMHQVTIFATITTSTPKPSPPSSPKPATTPPPASHQPRAPAPHLPFGTATYTPLQAPRS
jgi:site-specific DNA recombinase